MTGKDILRQYNAVQQEIKNLEHRIKKLNSKKEESEADTVVGSNIEFPYNERIYAISGFNVEDKSDKVERLEKILIKRKQKCESMKVEIEEFIDTIPDSTTRMVFTYRYIEELTWLQIARRIKRYDESYPRKIIHDRYLEDYKKG